MSVVAKEVLQVDPGGYGHIPGAGIDVAGSHGLGAPVLAAIYIGHTSGDLAGGRNLRTVGPADRGEVEAVRRAVIERRRRIPCEVIDRCIIRRPGGKRIGLIGGDRCVVVTDIENGAGG